MECNREEALRAKAMAEEKLANNDYDGARIFATRAQTLYPGLMGISQMLALVDVLASAKIKVTSGETFWYGVLGVNPEADEEAIKKQYRKLALLVHPDKNKSAGADDAFKLIAEAWSLLSDKTQRSAYDKRMWAKTGILQDCVPMPTPAAAAASSSSGSTPKSFWTKCQNCRMFYEYLYRYLHHALQCPNCFQGFTAAQTPAPRLKKRRFNAQCNVTAAQGNAQRV